MYKRLLLFICIVHTVVSAQKNNEIIGLRFKHLLLGDVLECHCKDSPFYNLIPEKDAVNATPKRVMFLMPSATLSVDRRAVHDLHDEHKGYSISFVPVKKPVAGIAITIMYNDALVDFAVKPLDIVQGVHGMAFYFYDKASLNHIVHVKNSILKYARGSLTFVASLLA